MREGIIKIKWGIERENGIDRRTVLGRELDGIKSTLSKKRKIKKEDEPFWRGEGGLVFDLWKEKGPIWRGKRGG